MIEWSPAYNTGLPQLDREHRKIVEQLNALETSMADGAPAEETQKLLNFIDFYVNNHFRNEEACFAWFKCPHAEENRQAHAEFQTQFRAASASLRENPGDHEALTRLHKQVGQWVMRHIIRVDRKIRPCLSGVPSSA